LENKTEPLASIVSFCVANESTRQEVSSKLVDFLKKCYPNFAPAAASISRICGCDAENYQKNALSQLSELTASPELQEILKLVSEVQTSDIPLEKGKF